MRKRHDLSLQHLKHKHDRADLDPALLRTECSWFRLRSKCVPGAGTTQWHVAQG